MDRHRRRHRTDLIYPTIDFMIRAGHNPAYPFARILRRVHRECYSGDRFTDHHPHHHKQHSMETSSQLLASAIDPKLVAGVAKGEIHALSQLYDQSSTVLFSLALRILDNREEAADLLQEIYLNIWKKVVRYDVGRGTPIAWLITLTRNRAIDRLRARGPRTFHQVSRSLDDAQPGQVADGSSDTLDSPADQELRNLVRKAWASLPHVQQQVIELAYFEGFPDVEIAAQLDQPVEAVKTCIALGMSQLLGTLQSYWEADEAV